MNIDLITIRKDIHFSKDRAQKRLIPQKHFTHHNELIKYINNAIDLARYD